MKTKVLLVGSKAREHAFAWKLGGEQTLQVIAAPGSAAIYEHGVERYSVREDDIPGLVQLAVTQRVKYVLAGPELPLSLGLADRLLELPVPIPTVGPTLAGAWLEASKAFANNFKTRHNIPTARYEVFDDPVAAKKFVDANSWAQVIKADGLGRHGLGVVVTKTAKQARAVIHKFMVKRIHGNAGAKIVIEERLFGVERSFIILTDGKNVISMIPCADRKRRFEGDKGPNTGGIGCIGSSLLLTAQQYCEIMNIVWRTIEGLQKDGIPYQGFLYFGVMITSDGIYLIEYNVRMGDPEAAVILPLLATPLSDMLQACVEGEIGNCPVQWQDSHAVAVGLVSDGYPDSYDMGFEIRGLREARATGALIFHAGTNRTKEPTSTGWGLYRTAGGRVLVVTGRGSTIQAASRVAYAGVREIRFEGMGFRRDIAKGF